MVRIILLRFSLGWVLLAATAAEPTWSKNAIPIGDCSRNLGRRISSPDGHTVLELRCRGAKTESRAERYLHVRKRAGSLRDVELDEGASEVLWSPDSKAFLVNGGTSAYAGSFMRVYLVSEIDVKKLHVTESVQIDMVKAFPPCRALNRDEHSCEEIAKHPEFNMSGLAWIRGSSAILVLAEVPCSSSYGGIMCQVQGYEVNVPTGSIAMRLTARDVKARWQPHMAWTFHIPDRPEYGSAQKQE